MLWVDKIIAIVIINPLFWTASHSIAKTPHSLAPTLRTYPHRLSSYRTPPFPHPLIFYQILLELRTLEGKLLDFMKIPAGVISIMDAGAATGE